MKKNSLISTLLFLFLSFLILPVSQADDHVDMIDATSLNPNEIDVKEALIYSALHYQWDIVEHTRNTMRWDYNGVLLDFQINGGKINITVGGDVEINPKWLARIKKLTLRRLAYHAEIRKAEAMIQ